MGVFSAKTGLRSQYLDMTFTQLNATNSATDAYFLGEFKSEIKLNFIDNGINADLVLYLDHPEADSSDSAYRLKWVEVGAAKMLNFSSILAQLAIEPGTKLYVSRTSPAMTATSGKLRVYILG